MLYVFLLEIYTQSQTAVLTVEINVAHQVRCLALRLAQGVANGKANH